jgi:hypothetical protein
MFSSLFPHFHSTDLLKSRELVIIWNCLIARMKAFCRVTILLGKGFLKALLDPTLLVAAYLRERRADSQQ